MKRVFIAVIAVSIVIGCAKEADVDPVSEKTFIRYYGTDQNDVAVLAMENNNGGYSLLSTTEIETGVTGQIKYEIHFTLLDEFGNYQSHTYPDPSENSTTASSFIQLADGYLIVGDRINSNNTTDLLLIRLSEDGSLMADNTISLNLGSTPPSELRSLHGKAVAQEGDSIIVLGSIGGSSNDMYVAKVALANLGVTKWSREYGDGPGSLISRVYVQSSKNIWGGSVNYAGSLDFRLIHAAQNSQAPDIGNPVGDPDYDENALDFCRTVGGWAVTGYTNEEFTDGERMVNDNQTEDIYIAKLSDNSQELFKIHLEPEGIPANELDSKNERGNSICTTIDYGHVVLATVETELNKEDLMITKISSSGKEIWKRKYYGGIDKQEGATVRENADGSLLVFGTTYFGNEKKLILLKVDKNGEL